MLCLQDHHSGLCRKKKGQDFSAFVRKEQEYFLDLADEIIEDREIVQMCPALDARSAKIFIFRSIEYRDGAVWGNPYLRILRSQLEKYISEELGEAYLVKVKSQAELRRIKKEISELKKKLKSLEDRKADLEGVLKR